ncbi:hypothetical protein J3Q64DRAFT_1697828 [Phycomyces blakesleeanus]|uniref:Uncharacterized protein n=2 Tax=Phycomyces blakesleeanus TaxID=4837 RepID=A0A163CZH5_PHYB8|nr:hypothetical protein PHYBLDRAFT_173976 [Phycomyces blakesleeanus NRRL 1555(-)]OAD67650.1 hypothetical protein PHYBLDRAFT_173976 [Phycomyces blakesleeanus NRRL 1555(-)]|eukprot:XP_018285690.1 hypothetical protein PHYBLDRAFT_173976 [Phycomyces blakesleeanus NRRL 1555(-)]
MNNFASADYLFNNFMYAAIAHSAAPGSSNFMLPDNAMTAMMSTHSQATKSISDSLILMMSTMNNQLEGLANQVLLMTGDITLSNQTMTCLQKTATNILAGQTVIHDVASRCNTTSSTELTFIKNHVKTQNFTSNNTKEIAANGAKSEWVMTSYLMSSDNCGLASAMSAYLQRQPCSTGMATHVLEGMVKNHFSNQVPESCRSTKTTGRKNTATRTRQRDVALLLWRELAYKENKDAIDKFMDRVDCAHAIQKVTMSDEESDNKDSARNKTLMAYCSSWRSIEIIYFCRDLNSKSSLLPLTIIPL